MKSTRIEMHVDGLNIIVYACDNVSKFSHHHKREFPIQGTIHCTSILDRKDERTTRIYARSLYELKMLSKMSAKRLFNKIF